VALKKKGAREKALKLLNEAQSMIKTDLSSETKTNAVFAVIAAYAVVEPTKAFAIVEQTIDRANDDVAKLMLLDRTRKAVRLRKARLGCRNQE
jgi:hypothetical protein